MAKAGLCPGNTLRVELIMLEIDNEGDEGCGLWPTEKVFAIADSGDLAETAGLGTEDPWLEIV